MTMMKLRKVLAAAAVFLALLAPSAAADAAPSDDTIVDEAPVEDEGAVTAEEAARAAREAARRADCVTRGFDVQALDCRLCEDLETFLAQATEGEKEKKEKAVRAVDADCRACCSDFELAAREDAAIHAQYAHAALEVCKRRLERYPKVANFVHNRAPQEHPQLEITYIGGRKPHLVFFDVDGAKQEEISIGNWDEDAISEFIGAKLRPAEVAQDDESVMNGAEETAEGDDEVVEVEVKADASS